MYWTLQDTNTVCNVYLAAHPLLQYIPHTQSISRKYYAEEELIAPEKTLVASLYGASSASVAIPLNEIVLKLYQLSLIEGTFFAPTSLDELDERYIIAPFFGLKEVSSWPGKWERIAVKYQQY